MRTGFHSLAGPAHKRLEGPASAAEPGHSAASLNDLERPMSC